MFILGQTGAGKSTFLKNMMLQDARNEQGFCLIDPHGDLINELIPLLPKGRINDVVYVNPLDI